MQTFTINPIGSIQNIEGTSYISIHEHYHAGLVHLEDFCHIHVLWWCHLTQRETSLQEQAPYHGAPEVIGVFATRSPQRPNPIALSCCTLERIDYQQGHLIIDTIDAAPGSPVVDIKPYTPSLDRIETPRMPEWCAHWPLSVETSAHFDWQQVFNF